jgi:hypothetical protein
MAANKCTTCFYAAMDKDLEAPCMTCTGYSNWVTRDVYKPSHGSDTLQEAIDKWFEEESGVTEEEFWYDTVHRPKHYMLFEEEGIEVRDVIEKLVWKIKMDTDNNVPDWEMAPMFDSDYTQMMQYLMRFMDKNGVEDLKKARWYLDKLIAAYDEHHV